MAYAVSILMCAILAAYCGTGTMIEENVAASEAPPAQLEKAQTIQDDRFEQIYPLNLNGEVKASNINGSIKVTTWDSPQVRLIAVKSATDPEMLKYVDVKVESTDASFNVKVDYKDRKEFADNGWKGHGDLKVEFELTVPRTADLVGITTVNGDVSIKGSDGSTRASTVNGAVRASELGGSAKLTTVNGTVEADFEQLYQGSEIKMTTVNGRVTVTLPSDANATVKASSLSGTIDNDFGLPVRKGEFVGRDLYGRLGSGDVAIKMSSVSGGLSVKRRNDGRQMNPATNLLKMKDDGNSY